jgi:hypothetical protein
MNRRIAQWVVGMTRKASKGKSKLPLEMQITLLALFALLKEEGPTQPRWPHYGKLEGKKDTYHCHLNKGRPTYVAVWKVLDKDQKIIEVQYVGTHENAPY